jgi:hypothetical protein
MYPYGYLTIKEIQHNETRRSKKNIKKHNACLKQAKVKLKFQKSSTSESQPS